MPQDLNKLIDSLIAQGKNDDEIRAAVKQAQAPPTKPIGTQTREGVIEFGKSLLDQAKSAADVWQTVTDPLNHMPEIQAVHDALLHPITTAKALPQAVLKSQTGIGDTQLSTGGKIGRTLGNMAPMLLGARFIGGGRTAAAAAKDSLLMMGEGTSEKAAQDAFLGVEGGVAKPGITAEVPRPTSTTADVPMTGPLATGTKFPEVPKGPTFTLGRPSPVTPTGTGSAGAQVLHVPQMTDTISINVEAPPQTTNGPLSANVEHIAEQAAEQAAGKGKVPYREPAYSGTERRGPSRVDTPTEDKAYNLVRKKQAEKAALDRAKAMLTGAKKTEVVSEKPTAKFLGFQETDEGSYPLYTVKGGPANGSTVGAESLARLGIEIPETPAPTIMNSAAPEIPKSSALSGFTHQPTKSLQQMVEEYGREGAASRAGMGLDELDARLEAGNDPAKLAKGLRDRLGAEKAARILGIEPDEVRKLSGGAPSRLPDRAVNAIRAAAEREMAENGQLSPQTQTLMDRIKSERGGVPVRALLVGGGAAGGATLGAATGEDSEDSQGRALLGALGGGALGFAPGNLSRLGRNALALRNLSMLSGVGPLTKHTLTGLGAGIADTVEANGRGASALGEMLRLPTNTRNFVQAFKRGVIGPYATEEQKVLYPGVRQIAPLPNRLIGAAVDVEHKALARAGVPRAQIDRYLLTGEKNVLSTGMQTLSPEAQEVARAAVPFWRVPGNIWNQGMESFKDLGKGSEWANQNNLTTLASMGGGAALQRWAGTDPRKLYIARILLALTGPRQLPAVFGGMLGAGAQGLTLRKGLTDTSPIPEITSIKSLSGWPPGIVTSMKRLSGGQ